MINYKELINMKNILIVALLSLFIVACGGESSSDTNATTTTSQTESEDRATPQETTNEVEMDETDQEESFDVVVELAGNDQMRYDKEEIRVEEGQRVKLVFTHTGKLPKESMGHNFVLLEKFVGIPLFAAKAMKAKDNDYIPEDGEDIIAHTKMIGGGESTSIIFDAPEKGTYDFICTFPGHYSLMQGKFIVE